jgi:hypothetical protein
MSYAEDMLNLRHEIDGMHAARTALIHRLNRFCADLHKSMARSLAEARKAFHRECARARVARHAFVSHNHEMVEGLLGAFGAERTAANRNFRGNRA